MVIDIMFFDESIDAKMNRYSFQLHIRDTPFLNDTSTKHVKTYVAPSVDQDGLDFDELPPSTAVEESKGENTNIITTEKTKKKQKSVYQYNTFPKLEYVSV
jgi:hypothetical protein